MSTVGELFAPKFVEGGELTEEAQARMAAELGCDSLRYLPVSSIARSIQLDQEQLCQACITGSYPTEFGKKLYGIALKSDGLPQDRTYESASQGSEIA
jgi:amidophosphoribosyltransferase